MLLDLLFVMSCQDVGNQQACQKAMEASTKQYHFYQDWEQAENVSKRIVLDITGETVWGAAAVGYKAYKERTITYTFKPKNAFVERITTKAGYQNGSNGSVSFQWGF